MHVETVTIIVDDYERAIDFYVGVLGFDLVEDSPSLTNDGRPKRWVVVRPRGGQAGLLLAEADGVEQEVAVGGQFAGRVGLFLRVDDFDAQYAKMMAAGAEFLTTPRDEPYGRVAVFVDISGNKWDLLGSHPAASSTSTLATASPDSPSIAAVDRFSASAVTHMLVVADPKASRDWYVSVLDASVYGEYGESVVLDLLGTWLLLVTGGPPGPDKPMVHLAPPPDPDHVSVQMIFRVEDCRGLYELLTGRGAEFLAEPLDRGGEIRAFFRDPDGHLFEISQLT